MPAAALADLKARGHKVTSTQWSAQVQAIRIVGPLAALAASDSQAAAQPAVQRRLDAASDPGKGGQPRGE